MYHIFVKKESLSVVKGLIGMTMGERLRALRLVRKISQEEVAKHIGITRSAYSHYEINNRQPVYDTLMKLAAYFGVSLDYMIGGTSAKANTDIPEDVEASELFALLQHMSQEQRAQSLHLLNDLMNQERRTNDGR
jgi:transcriptional regulator with XRE-family HTH domain